MSGSPRPNFASPLRRDRVGAQDDYFQSHAPVAVEYPVTATGVALEVYAAGRATIKVVVGTTDGKALAGAFSLAVESSCRPGRPGLPTTGGGRPYWSIPGVDADYKPEGTALAALLGEVIITGPVNRVRVRCTAFSVTSQNLAVWVL